jgi:hypothetical protein
MSLRPEGKAESEGAMSFRLEGKAASEGTMSLRPEGKEKSENALKSIKKSIAAQRVPSNPEHNASAIGCRSKTTA